MVGVEWLQIFRTKQSLYGLKLVLANSFQIHHGDFYIKQFLFKWELQNYWKQLTMSTP